MWRERWSEKREPSGSLVALSARAVDASGEGVTHERGNTCILKSHLSS